MKLYSDEIAALLRAVLWNEPLTIDVSLLMQRELWNQLYCQQMAHMVALWALNNHIPILQSAQQKINIAITLQRREHQNALLVELVSLLRKHHIEPILIKGYAIALLYPNPDVRDFADVDLYIGEEDYDRMIPIIRDAYPQAHWFSEEHGGLHFTMVLDENNDRIAELHRVTMELTHMPRANKAYQRFTLCEMAKTRTIIVNNVSVSIPSKAYNSLYIFMHAWHHFASSGVGLRQLADWALALHDAASEYELAQILEPVLKQMHMLEIWQTFGWVLVNKLGLPKNEFPLYNNLSDRKGEQLFSQLIQYGHGGRVYPYQRPTSGRLKQKLYTLRRLTIQHAQLAKLFPKFAICEYVSVLFL